jgi:hypothetical protein
LAFGHHRNCGLNLDAVDARMPRSRRRGIRDLSTGAVIKGGTEAADFIRFLQI